MLGIGMMVVLLLLSYQLAAQKDKNIADIDIVVGAKGSPLQIILSAVFQIDAPTGNIPLSEAQKWMHHPTVKMAIPLSLGDSYQSYRIVGTDSQYVNLYKGKLAEGALWKNAGEVVVGSEVQQQLKMKLGDSFAGAHGLADSTEAHEGHNYKIVGFLQPSGTVLDRLILTDLASVWEVHDISPEDSTREITALLLSFKGPMGMMQVPKVIQQNTLLQTANPATEWARLQDLMGNSAEILQMMAILILIMAGLSIFISLLYSLQERRYELSILRVMGASVGKIIAMITLEGLIISLLGFILGIIAGHITMAWLAGQLQNTYHYLFTSKIFLIEELYLLVPSLVIGLFTAILPAILSYRNDISKTLAGR